LTDLWEISVSSNIDFDLVFRSDVFQERFLYDDEELEGFEQIESGARSFLESRDWCPPIREVYVGAYFPPIVAVFLYRVDKISPARSGEPDDQSEGMEWVWIVMGDLPPACMITENLSCGLHALTAYVAAATDWIEKVEAGQKGNEVLYINLPHDAGKIELLRPRVKLLKKIFTESDTPPLFPGMFLDE
jgi:hypothetical protein